MRTIAMIAAVAVLGSASTSQAGDKTTLEPPAPKSADVADVAKWAARYLDLKDGESVVVNDDNAAYTVDTSSMRVTPSDGLKFWSRTEYFKAIADGDQFIRSEHTLYEGNCEDLRFRMLALDSYPLSKLQGELIPYDDEPDAKWIYPRPETVGEIMITEVCAYATKVLAEAETKKAELDKADGVWRPTAAVERK